MWSITLYYGHPCNHVAKQVLHHSHHRHGTPVLQYLYKVILRVQVQNTASTKRGRWLTDWWLVTRQSLTLGEFSSRVSCVLWTLEHRTAVLVILVFIPGATVLLSLVVEDPVCRTTTGSTTVLYQHYTGEPALPYWCFYTRLYQSCRNSHTSNHTCFVRSGYKYNTGTCTW